MKIGYARVSANDQNLDLQLDALHAHDCDTKHIYQEHASGKNTDRPELETCLKALRSGDTLTVWRLDRLGRSLHDLTRIITELEGRGVAFVSLTEHIDTTTAPGKLVFHLFASLAEFERNLIRERTMPGLASARARGKSSGRRSKLTTSDLAMAKKLMADRSNDVNDIAKRFGISRSTLYRVIKDKTLLIQPNKV